MAGYAKTANVRLLLYRYLGVFQRRNKRGQWRKFDQIGNYEVALHFAGMMRKLGVKVIIEDRTEGEDAANVP